MIIIEETDKYRLPTEAGWEHACRAGTDTDFSFGNNSDMIREYAWIHSNSNTLTHPFGTKKPNPWSLYDIHGNVWERCQDYWLGDYYPSGPVKDPAGPSRGGILRVMRSGPWYENPYDACCADRDKYFPHSSYDFVGFRCARKK